MKMIWQVGLVMLAMTVGGAAQTTDTKIAGAKDDLFAGTEVFAKNASDVTEITMDPDTLGMVGGRAHNMILNVVRTYEFDKPGMYRIEDVEAFRNKLNTGDWHCSVHTRSLKTGESTDICEKRRTDDLKETAIITVEPKELTFIHTIRKRGPGEDHSEFDGVSMFDFDGLPQLAMLGPKLAMMEARLATMPALHPFPPLVALPPLQPLPAIDSAEIQRNVDKAMKEFNSPEFKLKMKDAEKNGRIILDIEPPTDPNAPEEPAAPKAPAGAGDAK